MATYHGVLVFSEVAEKKTATINKELLNIGRRLSDDLSEPLSTLLIGKDIQELAKELITLGADKVYTIDIDSSSFTGPHPDLYVAIIAQVCQQVAPSIVLLGQTDMGRDVAPRLAARLGTTVTMDCIELAIDPDTKQLLQTKPVYGGNAMAIWISELNDPQIVTLRPRSVMPAEPDPSRKGKIINLSITVDNTMIRGKLLEIVKEEAEGVKLEEAKVIVAGGGGIGGIEGFKMLNELAKLLRGALGVTRVPCDEGWMPISLEIGQTGYIVSPSLYIAIGISGAPQHMAGCSSSKCIVAINKDPEAHIFEVSDFGLVGDYRQALPPLIEKCKELLK
jgi:electron transfer flavoprotein alpha subunit